VAASHDRTHGWRSRLSLAQACVQPPTVCPRSWRLLRVWWREQLAPDVVTHSARIYTVALGSHCRFLSRAMHHHRCGHRSSRSNEAQSIAFACTTVSRVGTSLPRVFSKKYSRHETIASPTHPSRVGVPCPATLFGCLSSTAAGHTRTNHTSVAHSFLHCCIKRKYLSLACRHSRTHEPCLDILA
jgi:hypothetical protein